MIIYKITCTENNKIYIGQTVKTLHWRWTKHVRDANNGLDTHFARAIRKYGADKFKLETIDTAITQDELTTKEYYWINTLHAADSDVGYNECVDPLKCGGNTYRSKSVEELNEIKHKISVANSGRHNGQAKAIKCKNINTNEEYVFDTIIACAEFFQTKNRDQIRKRLTGYYKLYKQYWMIAYKDEEYSSQYQLLDRSAIKGSKVKVTNLSTNEIREFSSKRKAAEELKIPRAAIINNSIINNYKIQL